MNSAFLSVGPHKVRRLVVAMGLAAMAGAALADASQPVSQQGSTSTGGAQSASGAGGVVPRAGFGCPSGFLWDPASPWLGCQAPPANCAATSVSSGGCTFSGGSVSVSPASPYTGNYSATCNNGGWVSATTSCTAPPCSAGPATSGACSFSLPTTASGGSQTVSTTTSGYTGSLTASCSAGSWSSAGATCNPNGCSATTLAWNVAGNACAGAIGTASSGGSLTVTDSAGHGSATFSCTTGSWSGPTSASCAPPALPMPPGGPSNTQITGGQAEGCDDNMIWTADSATTGHSTWDRSIDGRGYVFGQFLSKQIITWKWNGTSFVSTNTANFYTNYTTSTMQYCM